MLKRRYRSTMRKMNKLLVYISLLVHAAELAAVAANDPLDPAGSITVRWDVMQWTPDGYVALVNISNNQQYRPVTEPGWRLSWTWAGREVIWDAFGAEAVDQGDCSRFVGNIPQSCDRSPTLVDLPPNAPYNMQVNGCCRGGVLTAGGVGDADRSTAGFQLAVGNAGTTNRTVRLPRNFTFGAKGGGYVCGDTKVVRPTRFLSPDRRRVTQALMTWQTVCTYWASLASQGPKCCVSLSSPFTSASTTGSGHGKDGRSTEKKQRTNNMCPIRINWNVKSKGRDTWRTKVSFTNHNLKVNVSEWTMLLHQHRSQRLINVHNANHKALFSPQGEWEMLWGIKNYNDKIQRGSTVSMEVIYGFNGNIRRAPYFPQAVYFNGDACSMPYYMA